MEADPIVAEVRRIRELRAAAFDFDIARMVKDAKERDAAEGIEVVRLPPRSPIRIERRRSRQTVESQPLN